MRMIFVNLPVKDLTAAVTFYQAIGFTQNEQFSDDGAAGMVLSDSIWVMLLTESRFKGYINGDISTTGTEVINAVSADSKAEVDELKAKALAAGGSEWRPNMDLGFMYSTSFTDPDSHVWEVAWMEQPS